MPYDPCTQLVRGAFEPEGEVWPLCDKQQLSLSRDKYEAPAPGSFSGDPRARVGIVAALTRDGYDASND